MLIGLVGIGRKTLGIVVPVAHMNGEHTAAVGALPYKLGRGLVMHRLPLFVYIVTGKSAAENKVVNAESVHYLGQLVHVAELIGGISGL